MMEKDHGVYVTEETCSQRRDECMNCIHNLDMRQTASEVKLEGVEKIQWYILTTLILGFLGTISATVFTAIIK